MKRLILSALGIAILAVGISTALPVQTRPQPATASQQEPFDHSNCQYPDRWSNPVDGCDNSDPAVPECIKGFSTKAAEDACIAAFVAEHEQPALVETVTPAPSQESAQCGGK